MASGTLVKLLLLITTAVAFDDAMLVRFRNIADYDITLWWLTPHQGEEIRFFGHLQGNGGMTRCARLLLTSH